MSLEVVKNENTIGYPYLVISDIHLHSWSQFSHTLPNGRNNRLQQTLDEIEKAAYALRRKGGNDIVISGDLFHVRGNVKPSVLNPAIELFKDLTESRFVVHAIPGNHDLENTNSDTLGNAMYALSTLNNFNCYVTPTQLTSGHLFIPWYQDSKKVLDLANKRAKQYRKLTLFAHVGLNGVVPASIGNTLDPEDFDKGFKYVFCGHFHNHVSFSDRVFSVGALTHQTWSDVGSKAGYLIVHEDRVEHYETNAPTFEEVSPFGIYKPQTEGNYCRFKGELTEEEASKGVAMHKLYGALAVLDQSTRPSLIDKSSVSSVDVDLGVDQALESYCKGTFGDNWQKVYEECLKLKS